MRVDNPTITKISNLTTNGVVQTSGGDGTLSVAVGTPTGLANPSASVGLAAVNGSATTSMRSDGAPALDVNIAPTWTNLHIFKPSTNSTTAFRVQDKDGAVVVDVDTTNKRLGIGTDGPTSTLDVRGTTYVFGSINAYDATNSDTYFQMLPNRANHRCLLLFQVEGTQLVAIGPNVDAGTTNNFQIRVAGTVYAIQVAQDGKVGLGTAAPKSVLHVVGLPVYANNAAAVAGGLTAGAFYRTGGDPDPVCVVH